LLLGDPGTDFFLMKLNFWVLWFEVYTEFFTEVYIDVTADYCFMEVAEEWTSEAFPLLSIFFEQ
jgi:hypothetical protein